MTTSDWGCGAWRLLALALLVVSCGAEKVTLEWAAIVDDWRCPYTFEISRVSADSVRVDFSIHEVHEHYDMRVFVWRKIYVQEERNNRVIPVAVDWELWGYVAESGDRLALPQGEGITVLCGESDGAGTYRPWRPDRVEGWPTGPERTALARPPHVWRERVEEVHGDSTYLCWFTNAQATSYKLWKETAVTVEGELDTVWAPWGQVSALEPVQMYSRDAQCETAWNPLQQRLGVSCAAGSKETEIRGEIEVKADPSRLVEPPRESRQSCGAGRTLDARSCGGSPPRHPPATATVSQEGAGVSGAAIR